MGLQFNHWLEKNARGNNIDLAKPDSDKNDISGLMMAWFDNIRDKHPDSLGGEKNPNLAKYILFLQSILSEKGKPYGLTAGIGKEKASEPISTSVEETEAFLNTRNFGSK